MKRTLLVISLLSMAPGLLYAQAGRTDRDLDSELDQISASRVNPPVQAQGNGATATIAPQGQGGRSIYIVNQATPSSSAQNTTTQGTAQTATQGTVQKQQQVDITAAPLAKSNAEKIREARQQAEVDTENKVVEKLEVSRIEDEKRRAAVLFGEPFAQLQQQQNTNIQAQNVNLNQQTQAVQTVVPVAVVAPVAAPVIVAPVRQEPIVQPITFLIDHKEVEQQKREEIKEEIKEERKEERKEKEIVREDLHTDLPRLEEPKRDQRSFGIFLGTGDYPDVNNVRGNYSVGASISTTNENSIMFEGSVGYSSYTVNDVNSTGYYNGYILPSLVDMHQYSAALAVKYVFLDGWIRPNVGALGQYSYRTYTWTNNQNGYYGNSNNNGNGGDANSSAFDVGVSAGVDFQVTKRLTLGVEVKYLWNLANRINQGDNAGWFGQSPAYGTPIEQLQYYNAGAVARVNF